jgi:O-antigen/teichoic acid export membrane protein
VVTSVLSAWALGAEGRGDLAIVTMFPFVCVLVAGIGLPFAHRYWIARKPHWSSAIVTFTIVFGLVISVITIAISEIVIPRYVGERSAEVMWLLPLYLLNIPVLMMTEMFRGILEGARSFVWIGVARISFIAPQAIGYLGFWWFGSLTLVVAVVVITIAQILCLMVMTLGVWKELKPRLSWNIGVIRKEISYGIRSYPGILTEYGVLRLDQIMLAGMASSTLIGLYMIAVALAEITATLASSVADVLMPEVAASRNKETSTTLFGKSLRLTMYAHTAVLIPLMIAAPFVLKWVYGAEFTSATGAFRVLLIASVLWSAGLIATSALNGFGYPGLSTIARIASAVVTVVTLLILLPIFGIMGAAISSLIGYGIMLIVAIFWLWRKRGNELWTALRPQRDDFTVAKIKGIFKWDLRQPSESKT